MTGSTLQALAVLAAVLAGAAPVSAQSNPGSGPRLPAFGRVVDEQGKPLAGVEVTFAGGRPELDDSLVEPDSWVVASDRRGRVRAKLRTDLCYVAWASGPVDEKGTYWVSDATSYFAAGGMFELVCRRQLGRRVEVRGAEAWQEKGPLQFFLVTLRPGVELGLECDDEGRLLVPPLAGGAVEVRTADGQPLWSTRSPPSALLLPPPQSVRVRVADEVGQPIVGASLHLRVARRQTWSADGILGLPQMRMRELDATDAKGLATVVVPFEGDPLQHPRGELLLTARATGRAAVVGGVMANRLYVNDRRVEKLEGGELPFILPKIGEPLVTPPGLLPPGSRAQLVAVCKLFTGRRNGYQHDHRTFFAEARQDGSLLFDHVPEDLHSMRILLTSASDSRPHVFNPSARGLPVMLTADLEAPLTTRLGDLRLRVLDASGGPARGAVVCIAPALNNSSWMRGSLFRVPIDPTGQGSALLEPGKWICVVVSGDEFAIEPCSLPGRSDVELRLAPLPRMHVCLADAEGRPIAGARIRTRRTSHRTSRDPVQEALGLFRNQLLTEWQSLRTASDGNLAIPLLPIENVKYTVDLTWNGGASETFSLEPGEETVRVSPR